MHASRWICLAPFAFLLALPAAPQASLTPNETLDSLDSNASARVAADTPQAARFAPDSEQFGNQLMEQGSYQAALDAYQLAPVRSAKLWSRMGIAYQLLLNFNDAARCYKESIRLDPHNALFYNDLATAYDQLEDHRQAERLYRKAILLDPHVAVYFKNLGTNLLAQHKFDNGAEAYRQALSIDPHILDYRNTPSMALPRKDNAETNYVRARSCAQAGLTDCAVVYLRKALDEGSATRKKIVSDNRFQAVFNTPEVQQLLAEQR
jgi:tetratricopeptide (TPR) repeat protein